MLIELATIHVVQCCNNVVLTLVTNLVIQPNYNVVATLQQHGTYFGAQWYNK